MGEGRRRGREEKKKGRREGGKMVVHDGGVQRVTMAERERCG